MRQRGPLGLVRLCLAAPHWGLRLSAGPSNLFCCLVKQLLLFGQTPFVVRSLMFGVWCGVLIVRESRRASRVVLAFRRRVVGQPVGGGASPSLHRVMHFCYLPTPGLRNITPKIKSGNQRQVTSGISPNADSRDVYQILMKNTPKVNSPPPPPVPRHTFTGVPHP